MISHRFKINWFSAKLIPIISVKMLCGHIHNIKIEVILFLMVQFVIFKTNAQVFPVQANINVSQPLGVSIAELQQSTTPKIQASFLLADLAKPSYSVRLKFSIEGRGIVIKTKENVALSPLTLSPGIPVIIDHQSLNQYLQISNLDIIGIDATKFIKSGLRLPEGNYNICIEAYDVNNPNGLPVSNKACSYVQFVEYDPPLLMVPDFQNVILFESQPPAFQQALFTWQPLHFGFFPVEYQLEIFRGLPAMNMLPGGAIMSQTSPYISVRTMNTFYSLSPTDPVLLNEDNYYAVVRIIPINSPAIFKNQGKSQFVFFNLRDDVEEKCTAPQKYKGAIDRLGIALNWSTYKNCESYVTEYYDEDLGERKYQEVFLENGQKLADTIKEVYSNRTYIARTGCRCMSDTLYSDTIRLKYIRPHAQVPDFACGILNDSVVGLPVLLPSLNEDDTIIAADLEIIVRRAIGGNGTFSGIGHIVVPFFKYARVNAAFENIKVNDEYRMIAGEIQVIGIGQNILSDDFLEFLDSLNSTLEDVSEYLDGVTENLDSIQAMKDMLGKNMPPWLIDSISIVKEALAKDVSDEERKRLEALLAELNKKVLEWELMYINIVIEAIEELDEIYQENKLTITNTYFNLVHNFPDLAQEDGGGETQQDPIGGEGPPESEIIGLRTATLSNVEFQDIHPDLSSKFTSFMSSREEYLFLKSIEKLNNELKNENVLLFLWGVKSIGYDMVKELYDEFNLLDFDIDKITNNENLQIRVLEIAKSSVKKITFQL